MLWLISVCFLLPLGIISGEAIPFSSDFLFLLIAALILLAFLLCSFNFLKIALLFFWIINFLTGSISLKYRIEKTQRYSNIEPLSDRVVLLRVDSFPEFKKNITSFDGKILKLYDNQKVISRNLKVRINLEGKNNITYGQCILAKLNCKEPDNYGVPGVHSYKKILSYNEIAYICNLTAQNTITEIADCDYLFVPFIKKTIDFIRGFIKKNFSPPVSGFLIAITIGDRSEINDEFIENFRNSGTAHLLAISGLHIGIAGFFIFFIIKTILKLNYRLLIFFNIRRLTAILTIPFLFLFCMIAGMSPSTQRALIMSVILLMTIFIMRKPNVLYITSLTWCLMLIINPSSIFDISFQLSFSAVFAIILFYSKFNIKNFTINTNNFIRRAIQFITANILTTIAGFAGTAIIIAKAFKTISIFFIPANLIAVPISSFILPGIIVNLLLFWLPDYLNPLIPFVTLLTKILLSAVRFFGSMNFSGFKVAPPDNFQFVIYYLVLSLLFFRIKFRVRLYLLCILIILFFIREFNFNTQRGLKITFIDVGQGDSTFIEFPDGKNMLVDCGKEFMDFNAGERIIAPFLWHKKIKKINTLVMTHEQNDHIGGCNYILKRFNVDEIWIQDTEWSMKKFQIDNVNVFKFNNEIVRNNGDLKIISLNPSISEKSDDNNNSLVLKIEYKNFSLLLTGDIEKESEQTIIQKDLQSTIIKIPHHGSCTSSSYKFLKSVNPEIAIISAGRNNVFHHPCHKTIERIKKFTEKIFVTAWDGSITITTDGYNFCYSTYSTGLQYCTN